MDISKYSWDHIISIVLVILCWLLSIALLSMRSGGKVKGENPAILSTNHEYNLDDSCFDRSVLEPSVEEEVVEEMPFTSFNGEIADDVHLEQPSIKEIVEEIIPEHYRLIPHTSYTMLKKVKDTFISSKRHTRDLENIDTFIRDGPRCHCARIDALYRVRAGIKSHIAVQENDQYWAEQEKLFPHLKQMHEEEAASLEKTSEGHETYSR